MPPRPISRTTSWSARRMAGCLPRGLFLLPVLEVLPERREGLLVVGLGVREVTGEVLDRPAEVARLVADERVDGEGELVPPRDRRLRIGQGALEVVGVALDHGSSPQEGAVARRELDRAVDVRARPREVAGSV